MNYIVVDNRAVAILPSPIQFTAIEGNFTEKISQSLIKQFRNLEALALYNQSIDDLSFISALKDLTSLILINVNLNNISVLKSCKKLERLELQEDQDFDLAPLYSLTNLTYLVICDEIKERIDLDKIRSNNPGISIAVRNYFKY